MAAMTESAVQTAQSFATNLDPSLSSTQARTSVDSARLDTAGQLPPFDTRVPALPTSKGSDIDPALSSSKPHERLPHRLQTAHELPDTEPLSRQTSNADTQYTSPSTPGAESGTPKPARGRLPSISELIASGHDSRAFNATSPNSATARSHPSYAHHRSSRSVGSAGHNSPHPAPTSQMSPSAYAAYPAFSPSMAARSPTSAAADGPYYGTTNYYAPNTNFQHRRPSAVSDRGLTLPPSLNSASSSGDSGGAASSSMDGYSTSQTTPIDAAPTSDATPRPVVMLPPPPALMVGGFKCMHEGCTAPPFQTQYLLTSHKNVHSQNRPHYCPVKNCSRGEGGKGFKRKNEMIRHGLVHNSPGYICPFCPEREHRYPRPDNLQRHVRVHHVDKDRDDPALQEVLNQRTEGAGKTRRRRTLTSSPTAT